MAESSVGGSPSCCRCTVCTRNPLKQTAGCTIGWGLDDGTFEFLMDRDRDDTGITVDEETANKTANKASQRSRRMRRALSAGVDAETDRGIDRRLLSIAPFEWDEIGTGILLGRGGFSSVYEVFELCPVRDESRAYSPREQSAREFLATHTVRKVKADSVSKDRQQHHVRGKGNLEISRYAVKFMRPSLANHPRKFRKAAEDLVSEAQLLVALDHPNIISIRGWSRKGPEGYRSGKPSSFFMILDRLPETLEDLMWSWRQSHKKYKARCNFLWGKDKYADKLATLMFKRIHVASDVASAIEYMHSRRIINRDIKTSNVGFDVYGDVKVFDLGLSRILPDEEERLEDGYHMSCVGTRMSMAPEVRNKDPYDLSADVYSMGVFLWEVLSMSTPHDSFNRRRRPRREDGEPSNERTPKNDPNKLPTCRCWPEPIADLIVQALDDDPTVRPTMTDIRLTLECYCARSGRERVRRTSSFQMELMDLLDDGVEFDFQMDKHHGLDEDEMRSIQLSNNTDTLSSVTSIGPDSTQFSSSVCTPPK